MTVATIAFAAAAGATALAFSTTVLAWRMRARLTGLSEGFRSRLDVQHTVLGELDAATSAFDEAFLAIEGDTVRLVWGEETLTTVAGALRIAVPDSGAAPLVIEALAATSKEAADALKALIAEGKSCRFEVFAEASGGLVSAQPKGMTLVVEGRSSGATAWVRLAIASARTSLSSGPFAQMANRLPTPCWVVRDGQLVWANHAWLSAVEAQSLEQARADHLGLDRSTDALVTEAGEQNIRREGFRWLTIEGQRRAFQIIAEPLSDTYVCAYAIDVTEAEESREALKRHAKAHDETLDRLEDAVAIFGPEKRLTFHNSAFETLWDLEPAWLAERPTHGELLERLRQKRKLPETSDFTQWKAQELEFYGLTEAAPDEMWSLPNGRSLRVVRQPHPLGGLLLLFSDKTGELKLKAQFNSLIQVQRATLDQLNDAVSVFGSDGRLRLRNAAFDKFWALSAEDMVANIDFAQMAELCIPLVHDRGFWSELKARVTDTDPVARAPQTGEVKTSDGRLAQWRTQPLPDGATLVAFSDITTRRALEQAIEQRDLALTESVRLKRDFVANVSYELRTPLTTIVGYADLLQRQANAAEADPIEARNRNYLNAIQAAASVLARSIDDVLDMAQIDAGEMSMSLSEFNLSRTVAAALGRQADTLSAKGIRFDYTGLDTTALVRADQARLGQVLDHLLDYALRNAAQEGQVAIRSRKDGDTLTLEIGYTGRGIPYHTQAHIFDRFVGRERGGPGLGLALVKALVELHEGWITLESEPSSGATFAIHLPRQSGVGHEDPVKAPLPEEVTTEAPQEEPEAPVADLPPEAKALGLTAETFAQAKKILGMA
ncbi:PAS-domain containing protein [Asticcacaulis sp. BYS171W]|uniref:histidine kinase n=1 Tax=Asticcacaulis aquaticus TaxID=2984212 RepID=A0ABT5HRB7_9CAUL|nr:PAS domain-containing sensor histidine kinase [Asticcacaulis aquaticus]MDC7682608.1 PAS-domain containing protein [Asticcacaulis aquaticus]